MFIKVQYAAFTAACQSLARGHLTPFQLSESASELPADINRPIFAVINITLSVIFAHECTNALPNTDLLITDLPFRAVI